jgi:hypothetical protein
MSDVQTQSDMAFACGACDTPLFQSKDIITTVSSLSWTTQPSQIHVADWSPNTDPERRNGQEFPRPQSVSSPLFTFTRSLSLIEIFPPVPHSRTNIGFSSGEKQSRLTTGMHITRDIECLTCRKPLGWYYVSPRRQSRTNFPKPRAKLSLGPAGQGIRDGPEIQGRSVPDREGTPGTGQSSDTTLGLQFLVEAVNVLAAISSATWLSGRIACCRFVTQRT